MLDKLLNEPIPGGSRFAYVFGSALLFIFALQFVTGLCLALYYVPTPIAAHVSTSYIVREVAGGSFIRSLHSYGSSAMVVVLLMHFLQTFLYGSYKGKRELLWIAGCVLMLLVLGMAFTGYLLPWDQKAYFATSVGTNVAGQVPIVGELVRRLLRGGTGMGTLTLSRFYVLHVFVIPAMIVLIAAAHILLFRKAGPAGPVKRRIPERVEMFYPGQVLKDMAFALVVAGVLGALARAIPARLGPVANPADSHFLPRPEWYYLPLFQWLKYWEGPRAFIGLVVIPTILVALLFLLPFLDRGGERRPWKRPIPVGGVVIVLIGLLWLGIRSRVDDLRNQSISAQLARQQMEEEEYSRQPFQPYRASLAGATALSVRAVRGKAIFDSHACSSCHGPGGVGGVIGPSLIHIADKYKPDHVFALLRDPTDKMRAGGMRAPKLNTDELVDLVLYLGSLGRTTDPEWATFAVESLGTTTAELNPTVPAKPSTEKRAALTNVALAKDDSAGLAPGVQIFESHGCIACHGEGGVGTPRAPALINVGKKFSVEQLTRLLQNPTAKMRAGGMPQPELSKSELASLVTYLRGLRPPDKAPQAVLSSPVKNGQNQIKSDQNQAQQPREPGVVPVSAPMPSSSQGPSLVSDARESVSNEEPPPLQSRGAKIFESRGCSACHGPNGVGTHLAPALSNVGKRLQAPEIAFLLQHLTPKMRAGGMPQVNLSGPDMDELVAYVKSLSIPKGSPSATVSPSALIALNEQPRTKQDPASLPKQDPASLPVGVQAVPVHREIAMNSSEQAGKAVFEAYQCSRCHGVEGRNGTAAAPALAGSGARIPAFVVGNMLQHPTTHMRHGGMPTFSLSKQELDAIASYVSYISGVPPAQ